MGHRYIGSKTKILEEVVAKIKKIAPNRGHVVDLMSGTAAVSSALRKAGFKVTAVDLMTYSFHHARVALLLSKPPLFKGAASFIEKYFPKDSIKDNGYAGIIAALNSVPSRKGYFWNEFSSEGKPADSTKPRNYFSPENARRIDGIRYWIKKLYKEKLINDLEHSLLLHDLIMATNNIANISGTYGHYLSKIVGRAKDQVLLTPSEIAVSTNKEGYRVLQGYAEDLSKSISADLCYIDPPYMKRQYAANYHILETLGREDNPKAVGESGLRPWRDQYSNFCTKTKIRQSFETIFTSMNCSDFLISYSEDGLLKLDDLTSFFSEFGAVKVTTLKNKRFRSNKSSLDAHLTEYLIHLRVKR
jgi:adenine-specific DNA-methyltransferase